MSMEHVLDPDARLAMYGGTESSLDYQADGSSFFGKLFRMIDLPATLAMDPVLLQISMPVNCRGIEFFGAQEIESLVEGKQQSC